MLAHRKAAGLQYVWEYFRKECGLFYDRQDKEIVGEKQTSMDRVPGKGTILLVFGIGLI